MHTQNGLINYAITPRYWQGTARVHHREECEEFLKNNPELHIDTNPEARGVNFVTTMKNVGIKLEWNLFENPDENHITYRISLADLNLEIKKIIIVNLYHNKKQNNMNKKANYKEISKIINNDIKLGKYDNFPKLKKRLNYIADKMIQCYYIVNKDLSRNEKKTLIEEGYL